MDKEFPESELVGHHPCLNEDCGSSDGVGVYDDDHGHCYVCDKHYKNYWKEAGMSDDEDNEPAPATSPFGKPKASGKANTKGLLTVTPKAFAARGINLETVTKFQCGVSTLDNGVGVQVYSYVRDGKVVAQKCKTRDKKFPIFGNAKKLPLFGSQLWDKGKMLVVTEGELDCLTVSQVQGNKWPTVSIPNGSSGAAKSFMENLEYFDSFDRVIIMFDMDEPGQKAALEAAEVISPGKAYIATLPLNDPNQCLQEGQKDAIVAAIWAAKQFRPDGIRTGLDELWDIVDAETPPSDAIYPYPCLNDLTDGLRKAEVVTILAGSGVGKTTVCKEIAVSLRDQGMRVGLIMLEESVKKTLVSLIGIKLDKPLRQAPGLATREEKREAFVGLMGPDEDGISVLQHFGSADIESMISRVRFLAKGLNCDFVILDHISILVSGIATGDERKLIDVLETKLRTVVEETGVGLIQVSHLRRPEGDEGYEDGKRVTLGAARGSAAIVQISDIVIAINKDGPLEVLKNRHDGVVGEADYLDYSYTTGRLLSCGKDKASPFVTEEPAEAEEEECPF